MSKELSAGATPADSPSPSPHPEAAAAPAPTQTEKPPTTQTKPKRTKTTSTPQTTGLRAPRTTPTTIGPRQPSIHNTRATARKVESTTRVSRSGGGSSGGPLVFSLSRDAAGMSSEEIVREIGGRIALAESENIFDRKGGSTSLFDPAQKALDDERKQVRKKRSGKKNGTGPSAAANTSEVAASEKKKKKKKKSSGRWLEKKPGETPEKTYSSSPSNWEGTLHGTPTKSTVRGDEAKWMAPAPELAFKRDQDGTPTKGSKRKNKGKKLLGQMEYPLPPGWWNVLKMTDNQRELYIQLFEDSAEMTEESQYQLWNTALDIVYLAGEEEGTWGADPQREKKLSNWRAEMIYKHDLTIPPPISWNQKQLAVEPRPTDEERREYTKNFHTMYNNSYFWRILDQAWDKECLDKCLEANHAIWELKLKYRDFPWFCLPLPSEKWRTHTSQYIPKPSKNYCQWVVGLLDFGLMNFGDAEQIRVPDFQPAEREGAFEDSCHRAWLANAEYLPEGTTNPLDVESDEDSDATNRSDTPPSPEPSLSPEPELEIVEDNYYNGPALESQDSDSDDVTTDESEAAEENGEAEKEDDEEAVEETRQVGLKSKRGTEKPTSAGKRTKVSN